jgi:hypothetical protein
MWLFMGAAYFRFLKPGPIFGRMPNRLRARDLLRRGPVWVAPILIGVILIGLMTALYIGSAVDPVDHMHGLPVSLVEDDAGSSVGKETDLGNALEKALLGSPEVSSKLAIHVESIGAARDRMDRGASYATLVVPPDFSAAALNLGGARGAHPGRPGLPTVRLLSNQRAGTEGASLATGVLQPAVAAFSQKVGAMILAEGGSRAGPAAQAALADPVKVEVAVYRPAPLEGGARPQRLLHRAADPDERLHRRDDRQHFPRRGARLRAEGDRPTLDDVAADPDQPLADAAREVGDGGGADRHPHRGLPAGRRGDPRHGHARSAAALGLRLVRCGDRRDRDPRLFAVLGTPGQLVGLLIFVYLGLASAGGTVPIQALPGVFAAISHADPLRQILGGVRSILYLDARADAGLAEGAIATAIGLLFWLASGAFFVRRYDKQGRDRMDPELLNYVHEAADRYRDEPRWS